MALCVCIFVYLFLSLFFFVFLFFIVFFVLLCLFFHCFFFSSRRRHTRSLCDWSSDCALPISSRSGWAPNSSRRSMGGSASTVIFAGSGMCPRKSPTLIPQGSASEIGSTLSRNSRSRSEERRVGKECRCGVAP